MLSDPAIRLFSYLDFEQYSLFCYICEVHSGCYVASHSQMFGGHISMVIFLQTTLSALPKSVCKVKCTHCKSERISISANI